MEVIEEAKIPAQKFHKFNNSAILQIIPKRPRKTKTKKMKKIVVPKCYGRWELFPSKHSSVIRKIAKRQPPTHSRGTKGTRTATKHG